MTKLSVLQVVASMHLGGAERVVENLCRKLDPERFNVGVLCLKSLGLVGQSLVDDGYNVQLLKLPKEGGGKISRIRSVAAYVKAQEIDCVHTHGHADLLTAAPALFMNSQVSLIHTFHFGNYPHVARSTKMFEFLFSRWTSQLVAVSYRQRSEICRTYRIRKNRIETVWNGIEPILVERSPEEVRRELGLKQESIVVGSVGTLIEQKGFDAYLSIVAKICAMADNVEFVIVGFGPLEKKLKKSAAELGIEGKVVFAGLRDDVPEVMNSFDILVSPSLWEAMPIVLIEAMAVGLPIVATDVGDNSLVVENEVNGFIVPVGDGRGIADRIMRLCTSSELRAKMRYANKARFLDLFTADTMVQKYSDLYVSTCSKTRK